MLSCKGVALELSRDLDEHLPWPRRLRLRLHLLICHECRTLRKQLLILKEAAGNVWSDFSEHRELSESMSPEFVETLREITRRGNGGADS